MLTAAERNALILTVTFLLLGAGIKAWVRSRVELGPFPTAEPLGPNTPSPTAKPLGPNTPSPTAGPLGPETPSAGADPSAQVDPTPAGPTLAGPIDSLKDGPRASPTSQAPGSPKPAGKRLPPGKVDLNRASVERLAEVPGIGPRTAEAIVEYRRTKGVIRDVRELLEVKGIGERKLERIAPWVTPSAEGKPTGSAQTGSSAYPADVGAESAGGMETVRGLVSP